MDTLPCLSVLEFSILNTDSKYILGVQVRTFIGPVPAAMLYAWHNFLCVILYMVYVISVYCTYSLYISFAARFNFSGTISKLCGDAWICTGLHIFMS